MKNIISASRRTDIPAFYLNWFLNHLHKNEIEVQNPFNRKQVKRVSLSPRDVAWIVFWSRNYSVFLKNYQEFELYRLFFHFTINPANPILEPDMISPPEAFSQLEKLVHLYGPESVIWRYDPVVFYQHNGEIKTNHDIQIFRRFVRDASLLGLRRCYTSIMHRYPKVLKRAKQVKDFTFLVQEDRKKFAILQDMVDLASLYGVHLYSCSNDSLLNVTGMKKGSCIDGRLLNRLGHEKVSEKRAATRQDCGCTVSIDIGDYVHTPCKYHCLYCYARP